MALLEPWAKVLYRGIDITDELWPHLVDLTYTDKLHGEADEVAITVQDKDGLWRGPWCPEHGDSVAVWIGYKAGPQVPCGSFEIDEPNAKLGRSGDSFTFRGLAAPVTKALRTHRTHAYENKTLRQIGEEVAARNGLSLLGSPPDIRFERVTQRRERDLQFLTRMAEAFGCYFTVRGDQLVMARRQEVHERPAVFTIRVQSSDYLDADLKKTAHRTFSASRLSYFEGNRKREIDVTQSDRRVKTGDTLRMDERVETESQAKERAKSELEKENMKKQTASIELPGNPLLLAGQIVALDQDFGTWAGRYVVQTSRHKVSRKAYSTHIESASVD